MNSYLSINTSAVRQPGKAVSAPIKKRKGGSERPPLRFFIGAETALPGWRTAEVLIYKYEFIF
jgi:hypothetical protein